jgi:hypothetical protein
MKCDFCGLDRERQEWCDWQQGRCPHRRKPTLTFENLKNDPWVLVAVLLVGGLALTLLITFALQ